jgi:hypothetical protein
MFSFLSEPDPLIRAEPTRIELGLIELAHHV